MSFPYVERRLKDVCQYRRCSLELGFVNCQDWVWMFRKMHVIYQAFKYTGLWFEAVVFPCAFKMHTFIVVLRCRFPNVMLKMNQIVQCEYCQILGKVISLLAWQRLWDFQRGVSFGLVKNVIIIFYFGIINNNRVL